MSNTKALAPNFKDFVIPVSMLNTPSILLPAFAPPKYPAKRTVKGRKFNILIEFFGILSSLYGTTLILLVNSLVMDLSGIFIAPIIVFIKFVRISINLATDSALVLY